MELIKKKLAMLRHIYPDPGFMMNTKKDILLHSQVFSVSTLLKRSPIWLRTTSAVALLIMAIISIPFLNKKQPSLSTLGNAEKLSAEAAELPISIELQELSYQNSNNEVITAAISEIKDTNSRHLNNKVIESEIENIKPQENREDEINILLDRVTL